MDASSAAQEEGRSYAAWLDLSVNPFRRVTLSQYAPLRRYTNRGMRTTHTSFFDRRRRSGRDEIPIGAGYFSGWPGRSDRHGSRKSQR